jgi:hypothetical protein
MSFGEFAMAAEMLGITPNACCNISSPGFEFSGAESIV